MNLRDLQIEERVEEVYRYFTSDKKVKTCRDATNYIGASKSTIHKDATVHLRKLNYQKWKEVQQVLQYNTEDSYYRGGEATRQKYLKQES